MLRLIVMLALVSATAAFAQSASAPPTPPTDPNGWVREIQIADKLVEAGYVDQAQTDYESIIQRYPSNVAGIDKAWMGLSRIHMARGEVDQGKVALEVVLQRNSDLASVQAAKTGYKQLKDAADGQVNQAYQLVQYLEYRNAVTPWFDLFTKLFNWLDLRSAKKKLDAASAQAQGFDPHYLIDIDLPTIQPATAAAVPSTEAAATVHTPPATTGTALQGDDAPPTTAPTEGSTGGTPVTAQASPSAPPVVTQPSAAPVDEIVQLQRNYQEAYRKLQEAIASGNQTRVIEANKTYQAALEQYRQAAAAVR